MQTQASVTSGGRPRDARLTEWLESVTEKHGGRKITSSQIAKLVPVTLHPKHKSSVPAILIKSVVRQGKAMGVLKEQGGKFEILASTTPKTVSTKSPQRRGKRNLKKNIPVDMEEEAMLELYRAVPSPDTPFGVADLSRWSDFFAGFKPSANGTFLVKPRRADPPLLARGSSNMYTFTEAGKAAREIALEASDAPDAPSPVDSSLVEPDVQRRPRRQTMTRSQDSLRVVPAIELDEKLRDRAEIYARDVLALKKPHRIMQFLWYCGFELEERQPADFLAKFGRTLYSSIGELIEVLERISNLDSSRIKKGKKGDTFRMSTPPAQWVEGRLKLLGIGISIPSAQLLRQRIAVEVVRYVEDNRPDVSDSDLPFLLAHVVFGYNPFMLNEFVDLFGTLSWSDKKSLRGRLNKMSSKEGTPISKVVNGSGTSYAITNPTELFEDVRGHVLAEFETMTTETQAIVPKPVVPLVPAESPKETAPTVATEKVVAAEPVADGPEDEMRISVLQAIFEVLEEDSTTTAKDMMSGVAERVDISHAMLAQICRGLKANGFITSQGNPAMIQLTEKAFEVLTAPEAPASSTPDEPIAAKQAAIVPPSAADLEAASLADPTIEELQSLDEMYADSESDLRRLSTQTEAELDRVVNARRELQVLIEEAREAEANAEEARVREKAALVKQLIGDDPEELQRIMAVLQGE